ncbi:hypothetical protein NDA14_006931 [Ustilago hordei]|nr:hypothetical protein NDA14_006931 [Ustilago hordei]UTT96833.1 hypothetical protein NDA17_004466 [Ustilago hordei]
MIDRTSYSSSSLLFTIRTALSSTPPSVSAGGKLRIHTLFSIPRQVQSLYPLAHIHPTDLEYNKRAQSIVALEEQVFVTATYTPHPHPSSTTPSDAKDAPLLVLAMELYLYTIPEFSSAVLYISKLDTTGYGPNSIPLSLRSRLSDQVFGNVEGGRRFGGTLTATLTAAVTEHFTSFKHWDGKQYPVFHLSVYILARSQRAYLFPSSPENRDKRVLSDGGLIKWWRGVMSHVVVSTRNTSSRMRRNNTGEGEGEGEIDARAYYLIPGYNQLESHPLVPLIRDSSNSASSTSNHRTAEHIPREARWTYGHPYSPLGAHCAQSDLPPLPLHWRNSKFVISKSAGDREGEDKVQQDPEGQRYDPKKARTVPTLMPHFSDDPKTRFLDEMARDAHEHSGWKKKGTGNNSNNVAQEGLVASGLTERNGIENQIEIDIASLEGENGAEEHTRSGEEGEKAEEGSKKRSASNERTAGREAKRSKTTEASSADKPTSTTWGIPLTTLRALMRERQAMDDLPIDEFWERMAFRQECCSGNAVGVIVVLFTRVPPNWPTDVEKRLNLERQPLSLPYKVLGDLAFKCLMKDSCEWNKPALARTLTEAWSQGVDRQVRRKGGLKQFLGEEGRAEEAEAEAEAGLVGEGVIWGDFELVAPSEEQLEAAKKELQGGAVGANGQGVANTLSVKRKKKPQA